MKIIIMILIIVQIIVLPSFAKAAPGVAADIPGLVAASDLIVEGHSVPMEWHVQSDPPTLIIAVSPDRILKGTFSIGQGPILVDTLVTGDPSTRNSYGIFFLRRGEGAKFVEATAGFNSVFALEHDTPIGVNSDDPLTAITREEIAVLSTPPTTLSKLAPQLSTTPTGKAEFLYFNASELLQQIPLEISIPLLKTALDSSSDVLVRCWLIRTLVGVGAPVSFNSIKSFLETPSADADFTWQRMLGTIANIGTDNMKPNRIPEAMTLEIINFLQSPNVEVRRAAARSLKWYKTEVAGKALATFALRDKDEEVRISAEQGLCWWKHLHTPPCDVPAAQNEAVQRSYWTNWAVGLP